MIRAYASRTGTRENLAALRRYGWGLLISAAGVHRDEGFDDIVLDNGAWSAHTSGREWDPVPFCALLDQFGAKARWVVLPDIVGGGASSLALSLSWRDYCLDRCAMAMLAVQDGMTPDDVRPHVSERVGIFVGGSTEWKIGPMLDKWGALSREKGVELHVARVNSVRRINRCRDVGADSFDGSGPSRFLKCLERLERGRRQGHLWGGY